VKLFMQQPPELKRFRMMNLKLTTRYSAVYLRHRTLINVLESVHLSRGSKYAVHKKMPGNSKQIRKGVHRKRGKNYPRFSLPSGRN